MSLLILPVPRCVPDKTVGGKILAVSARSVRDFTWPAVAWVRKTYWAVVETPGGGSLPAKGTINQPVQNLKDEAPQSRPALTHYRTLAESKGLAWLEMNPITGTLPPPPPVCAFCYGSHMRIQMTQS